MYIDQSKLLLGFMEKDYHQIFLMSSYNGFKIQNDKDLCLQFCHDLSFQHPLSHRCNVANRSLFYLYFHGKCSDDFHCLITIVSYFTHETRDSTSTELNHPHFPRVTNVRIKFHTNCFFPKILPLKRLRPNNFFELISSNHRSILISSYHRSIIIYPLYFYNLNFNKY